MPLPPIKITVPKLRPNVQAIVDDLCEKARGARQVADEKKRDVGDAVRAFQEARGAAECDAQGRLIVNDNLKALRAKVEEAKAVEEEFIEAACALGAIAARACRLAYVERQKEVDEGRLQTSLEKVKGIGAGTVASLL